MAGVKKNAHYIAEIMKRGPEGDGKKPLPISGELPDCDFPVTDDIEATGNGTGSAGTLPHESQALRLTSLCSKKGRQK